jgi:hypothetical protein
MSGTVAQLQNRRSENKNSFITILNSIRIYMKMNGNKTYTKWEEKIEVCPWWSSRDLQVTSATLNKPRKAYWLSLSNCGGSFIPKVCLDYSQQQNKCYYTRLNPTRCTAHQHMISHLLDFIFVSAAVKRLDTSMYVMYSKRSSRPKIACSAKHQRARI